MRNINFLIRSFHSQLPSNIDLKVIEKEDGYVLEINKPNEIFNNYFSPYYMKGTTSILIRDDDYKVLLELSKVLKRYFNY